jgi:hypothetical protein
MIASLIIVGVSNTEILGESGEVLEEGGCQCSAAEGCRCRRRRRWHGRRRHSWWLVEAKAKRRFKREIWREERESLAKIESSETFTGQYWTVQSLHMRREM